MSENRWYYTDPRVAGYMHEAFGMQFVENFEISEMYIDGALRKATHPAQFVIHPDSLRLLVPKDGDIVGGIDSDGFTAAVVSVRQGTFGVGTNIVWAGSEEYRRYRGERIIQRDGKPFFWPESEAA